MNFEELPLKTSLVGKTNYQTIRKMSRTNSKINDLTNRTNMVKMDLENIILSYSEGGILDLNMYDCSKYCRNAVIDRRFKMSAEENSQEQRKELYQTVKNILEHVNNVGLLEFFSFTIDGEFMKMLQELPLTWRTVSVRFNRCHYDMPREQLLPLWKMFETTEDWDGRFREKKSDVIDDEMILYTLPSITLNISYDKDVFVFEQNEKLTDKTLEILVHSKPSRIEMGHFIVNYSTEGVKQLIRAIVNSRECAVDNWGIGTIELNFEDYIKFFEDLTEFENEYSEVTVEQHWSGKVCRATISYKKNLPFLSTGHLCIGLVKPAEILQMEAMEAAEYEEQIDIIQQDGEGNDIMEMEQPAPRMFAVTDQNNNQV